MRIQCSASSAALMTASLWHLERRDEIRMKGGRGAVTSYWLIGEHK